MKNNVNNDELQTFSYYQKCLKNNELPIPNIAVNESLFLSEMKINDAMAESLGNSKVKNLVIDNCRITDRQIEELINGCQELKSIVYSAGDFGMRGLQALKGVLPKLNQIAISKVQRGGGPELYHELTDSIAIGAP